jgi:hypothetical protein
MRLSLSVAVLAAIICISVPARADQLYGLVGNDTGGIIPYSPPADQFRKLIAADHCARYGKLARITSVHRQYGDYIGFRCLFPPPVRTVVARRPVLVRAY